MQDPILSIETMGKQERGQPFSDTPRAGQISLHADMLVQGSEANLSDRRRCGLALRCCQPEVGMIDPIRARRGESIIRMPGR